MNVCTKQVHEQKNVHWARRCATSQKQAQTQLILPSLSPYLWRHAVSEHGNDKTFVMNVHKPRNRCDPTLGFLNADSCQLQTAQTGVWSGVPAAIGRDCVAA
jgi:hypothetical protein